MTKAIRIHSNGTPDVMRWESIAIPAPSAGDVRLRHTVIAVNFSDVNVRRGGFYFTADPRFPIVLGNEAAGVVTELGSGVRSVRVGDRVAYVGVGGPFFENTGSYAEERNVPASCLIPLPDDITERQAGAFMLKGLTASLVINRMHKPKPGEAILIHAAASGVGLPLTQWAKHLGATVLGTVGSTDKARLVKSHGCDHPILYRETDFVQAVKAIVPKGVHAVFDGVGKDTFAKSFECTRPFGMLVNYGNASGLPDPVDLRLLSKWGSLSVCRPGFHNHIHEPNERRAYFEELFDLVRSGVLKIEISHVYPLRDAAAAHRDVEARMTSGSVVLEP